MIKELNSRAIDLTGHRYGRWAVLHYTGKNRGISPLWLCRCDCGTEREVTTSLLRSQRGSKSCGCLQRENASSANKTHNLYKHPLYYVWAGMKDRCLNSKSDSYFKYGGRGIGVCDRWKESFANFLAGMGERPEGTSLDRIDVNGDYCPENCRWANIGTQNFNTRKRSTNKSGKMGVLWREDKQKWRARINKDGVEIHLGYFNTFEDAVVARKQAEINYYGFNVE